jgi:hypothetical protein
MTDQPDPSQAQQHHAPKRGLNGKLVLIIVATVAILFGLRFIPAGASSLKSGDCFSGNPLEYPTSLKVVACNNAAFGDWKVVFAEKATGNSYPGNIDELRSKCVIKSGFFPPSAETWGNGDRNVICETVVVPR